MFRVIYVLIDDNVNSKFIDQLLLSIYTLKRYNNIKDISPIIFTDQNTNQFIRCNHEYDELLKGIKIKAIDIPKEFNNSFDKSRYLKTNLRNYIQGDFLYLYSDTFICDDLTQLNNFEGDLGLVYDCHCETLKYHPCLKEITFLLKKTKSNLINIKNLEEQTYYNSGIMFVRDTPKCKAFFSEWHSQWRKTRLNEITRDQPSLFLTNLDLKLIKPLPLIYNFQLVGNVFQHISETKIIHYFNKDLGYWCTNEAIFKDFIKKLKSNNLSDKELKFINHPKSAFLKNLRFIDEESHEIMTSKIFVCIKIIKIRFPILYNSILVFLNFLNKLFNKSKPDLQN